jgi:hypothetical protein
LGCLTKGSNYPAGKDSGGSNPSPHPLYLVPRGRSWRSRDGGVWARPRTAASREVRPFCSRGWGGDANGMDVEILPVLLPLPLTFFNAVAWCCPWKPP